MKKTLRYLLIVIAMVNFLSVSAQTPRYGKTYKPFDRVMYTNAQINAQLPAVEMRSTGSDYMATGSALPQAAVAGTTTTYDNPGGPAKMRRDVGGGGSTADDEDPDAPEEPFPLGDSAWPLLMLAAAYALLRVYKERKRVRAWNR